LLGKSEGKRPVASPGYRCDNNTEVHLKQEGWEGIEWIYLAQDRDVLSALVNTVMNLQVE
jgi:hypothetical protein